MRIKIATENAAKINAALAAVNGKADAFTIRHYDTVVAYSEEVEKQLRKSLLPKADRAGASAVITPAGPSAKAYKYAAKSTSISIERGASAWFLVFVRETSVYPKQAERICVSISETQRDTIARKAVEPYRVLTGNQVSAA